jgi:rRNA-processing protein FCF1
MREINWQSLDKDQIIDVIIRHNASVGSLQPEVARRIKNKLDAMDASALWRHIYATYGGKLYVPDTVTVTELEVKKRESKAEKIRIARKAVKNVSIPVATKEYFTRIDNADTEIFSKDCVRQVFRIGNKLVVLMADHSMTAKLIRWIGKKYPDIDIEVL